MMLVAWPRIFGAMTTSDTLATAKSSTAATPSPLRAQAPGEPARGVLEVLRPFEREAGRAPPATEATPLVFGGRSHDLVVLAHAASSSVSWDATIST